MQSIQSPLPQFFDLDGTPLDAGYIYIGTAGSNAETSPTPLFWDLAGTQPAAQPLRTVAGYIARAGKASLVFVGTLNYSLTVRDRNGKLIYSTVNVISGGGVSSVVSALYFTGDLDTGFEHPADGTIVVKTNGTDAYQWNPSGTITQAIPVGGDFQVIGSTAAGVESALRLNQSQATSGIGLKISNSGLNVQTTVRGRSDGGASVYVGQAAGASSTAGVQALDVTGLGNVVVGTTGSAGERSIVVQNTNAGAGAFARSRVQSDSGSLFMDVASSAGGGAVTIYSNTGSALNLFTQTAQQLRLGTNNNANRLVIGASGGITSNEIMTFSGSNVPVAKNVPKAWVYFNGTLPAASMIQDSYNVATITDNGTGDYTVNFTSAFSSANYAMVAGVGDAGPGADGLFANGPYNQVPTTTTFRLKTTSRASANFTDPPYIYLAFFGD